MAGDATGRDTAGPPARGLALPQATALVLGSVIGVGVFDMPGSLAEFGPISIVALALTTVGALCVALLFASLASRLPADGGPYAYARVAFGNGVGFATAWLYWITTWGGNAAIAVGWVLYVEKFVNTGHAKVFTVLLVLAGIWGTALINLAGLRRMGQFQLWTSILKFFPLLLIAVAGLFFLDLDNFASWNTSGMSAVPAIGGAMALCLFAYIGVESASVGAARVRDPQRNIPRATMTGTLLASVAYLLSLVTVFGLVPSEQLRTTSAPFSAAAENLTGFAWAGEAVALVVVISGFGTLNGWTMLAAEMPRAAAQDGLFPARFDRLSRRGVPAFGVLTAAGLATVVVLVSYAGSTGYAVFNTLVLMVGIAAAVPYGLSALAQIRWRLADRRQITTSRLVRDVVISVVVVAFSILFVVYSTNTEEHGLARYESFLYAGVILLVGLPVYLANRSRMTPPPQPPPAVADLVGQDRRA